MELKFYKYEGAGNDFILLDGRDGNLPELTIELISGLCHRRFGIGADGLMVLENSTEQEAEFSMRYFNSDGREGSMCGNGGRCMVRFADDLGIGEIDKTFIAVDGIHTSKVIDEKSVAISMNNVNILHVIEDGYFLDTGSPHLVVVNREFDHDTARRLRQRYDSNVNYVNILGDSISIRTFERGVENETWACGTGAVASAMVIAKIEGAKGDCSYTLEAKGGELGVTFFRRGINYSKVELSGPARRVFEGTYTI